MKRNKSDKKYKHLFFDIDQTLWDYQTNSRETISDIYAGFEMSKYGFTEQEFFDQFYRYNEMLWIKYRNGNIAKKDLRVRRFYLALKKLGLKNNDIALKVADEFIKVCPEKTNLFPKVIETLDYLKKHYQLYIITNGFNEIQFRKIDNSGIESYFKKVFTSDNAGAHKPNSKIFQFSLSSVHAKKEESLMIGDDWVADIMGAKKFGIDQVYFNPQKIAKKDKPTFEIHTFDELSLIL